MINLPVFLLTLGAVARITRFINADYLARKIREWAVLATFDPQNPQAEHDLPYLLTCPWCASVWVAGAMFPMAYFWGHTAAYWIVAAALTASYLYGVAQPLLDPAPAKEEDAADG